MDANETLMAIDPEEVADLAERLGAIESPAGRETEAAEAVAAWMDEEGFEVRKVALLDHRPAIVGTYRGKGTGPSLLFNAHLDTAIARDDWMIYRQPDHPRYISAWREGQTLYGNGVVNDKGPMAAFLVAIANLKRAQVTLQGDVMLTAVPGEIGLEPVDEYQGLAYVSKDLGARFMIAHGVVADAAIVAEATENALGWVMAGKAFFRFIVYGAEPLYTPYVPPETDLARHPNAILRLAPVLESLNEWMVEYSTRTYDCEGGVVQGRANIGAIRSGRPEKLSKSTQSARLYMDVRLLPGQEPMGILNSLRRHVEQLDMEIDVDCFLYRRGFEAAGAEQIVSALRTSHREEFGAEPERPAPEFTSMWRDTNPFNEVGIPSVTYGPASGSGGGGITVDVGELARSARVYARSAVNFCGVA